MSLYSQFQNGSEIALSRIISHIENRTEGFQELLSRMYRTRSGIYRIGITGPPGAGKSSLVNRLATLLAEAGRRVAIICVDPSSPFTGGALLGDRLRMQDIPKDKGVYIRSMGSRGWTGGLAEATSNVVVAFDAFGFDTVLIETVGVGQMELDIIDNCDSVVVTLVPESGDAIQALKAGLMEIADLFVVNKSDRAGAEQMVYDLKSALEMKSTMGMWWIPIIQTQAIKNVGIDELLEKIYEHIAYLKESGELEKKRGLQIRHKVEQVISRLVNADIARTVLGEGVLDDIVDRILAGDEDPFSAGQRLYDKYKGVT